jgi:hypothetical protein
MGSTWSCLITIVGLHVQPFSCHMLISPTKEMHYAMTQLNPWLPKSFKLQRDWNHCFLGESQLWLDMHANPFFSFEAL